MVPPLKASDDLIVSLTVAGKKAEKLHTETQTSATAAIRQYIDYALQLTRTVQQLQQRDTV